MNYSADKPIVSKEGDLLGRSTFSNKLAKAIYEYNDDSGLVIGLFGEWGTGKTSVINMAEEELLRLSKTDDNKPLFVKFSPWNYSDQDNLISLFFHSLNNKLQNSNNEKLKRKIGDFLKNYADAVDGLAAIPAIGSALAPILKTILKVKGDNLTKAPDLEESKEELKKALSDISSKIVVVIDDIDRLDNSQIRDIFQLVKQVGDFPNVIYVLLMDREVVSSALKEVHNIDGNEYLEKIIQVPFEIPDLSKEKLYSILQNKIESIYMNLPKNIFFDKEYWVYVFRNCVFPYIKTIRDINRVLNNFQFRYGALYQETSFEDMLALTTIEVLEPKLYKWIQENKDSLCGTISNVFFANNLKPNYRERYKEKFEKIGLNTETTIRFIATLFPKFSYDVEEHIYIYDPNKDIRGSMRVAHSDKFDIYFSFDLDNVKVPREMIYNCINKFNENELYEAINGINITGNIIYFLEEINSLVSIIPYKRLNLITCVLLCMIGTFKREKRNLLFKVGANDCALKLINDILKIIKTEKERYEIIKTAVENASKSSLGYISNIINKLENSYGRLLSKSIDKYGQLISIDQLEKIEIIYVKKVGEIFDTESISDMNGFHIILYLWKCFDEESADKYLEELFIDDVNKIKFVCSMAEQWNSSDNKMGWGFLANNYEKYVTSEEIYEIIKNLSKKKLGEFTKLEQLKIAAFYLSYEKNLLDGTSEEDAIALLKQWKDN